MNEPNEQQKALIEQHKLNPANWLVLSETSKKLITRIDVGCVGN